MEISKFNLYKSEWLELVFAERNKEYGAYYLRQHYAGNVVKAMAITFISVTSIFFTAGILLRHKPQNLFTKIDVPLTALTPPIAEPKKQVQQHQKPSPPKQAVSTKIFVPPVVVNTPAVTEPTKIDELKDVDPGSVNITIPGDGTGKTINDGHNSGDGTATAPAKEPEIYIAGGLEVNPEPYGGAAAWAKFLQKNLRYPHEAAEKGINGKVYVSFVVEKDGTLSSFTVERGAGYGMDEESLRVLKKAPAWKPGRQNGQPVRVKYTLPLNFVLNQD